MLRLAFDTATPELSLALARDGEVVATHEPGALPGGGRRVLESIHDLARKAGVTLQEVERIVVGVGPGGFTGIRIGIASALGLAHGTGAQVRGVSSLAALALGVAGSHPAAEEVVAAIDARRSEAFAARYRREGESVRELTVPAALSPEALVELVVEGDPDRRRRVGGSAVGAYRDRLAACGERLESGARVGPAAVDLLRLDAAGIVLPARPVYCRLPDAELTRRKRARESGT